MPVLMQLNQIKCDDVLHDVTDNLMNKSED